MCVVCSCGLVFVTRMKMDNGLMMVVDSIEAMGKGEKGELVDV